MTLKYLKSLSLTFTLLAFAACSSSGDSADTDTGDGDGALTATEQAQVESAATGFATMITTTGVSSFSLSTGFSATSECSSIGYEEGGSSTETETIDGSTTTTTTIYEELLSAIYSCADTSVSCFEDCAEADQLTTFSILIDGETVETDSDSTDSIEFTDFSMDITFGETSASLGFDGSASVETTATEEITTITDFTMSVASESESVDVTMDGVLTEDLTTELLDGTLTITINGDTATCVFEDYSPASTTPPACTI